MWARLSQRVTSIQKLDCQLWFSAWSKWLRIRSTYSSSYINTNHIQSKYGLYFWHCTALSCAPLLYGIYHLFVFCLCLFFHFLPAVWICWASLHSNNVPLKQCAMWARLSQRVTSIQKLDCQLWFFAWFKWLRICSTYVISYINAFYIPI